MNLAAQAAQERIRESTKTLLEVFTDQDTQRCLEHFVQYAFNNKKTPELKMIEDRDGVQKVLDAINEARTNTLLKLGIDEE